MLGVTTLFGRFALFVPMIALGGFLSNKKIAPASIGTFPVTGPLFVTLLIGVILIVGALTFFPVLALGPLVEQLSMAAGRVF
jgi:K+-transporting ATPase ATPase A chain